MKNLLNIFYKEVCEYKNTNNIIVESLKFLLLPILYYFSIIQLDIVNQNYYYIYSIFFLSLFTIKICYESLNYEKINKTLEILFSLNINKYIILIGKVIFPILINFTFCIYNIFIIFIINFLCKQSTNFNYLYLFFIPILFQIVFLLTTNITTLKIENAYTFNYIFSYIIFGVLYNIFLVNEIIFLFLIILIIIILWYFLNKSFNEFKIFKG